MGIHRRYTWQGPHLARLATDGGAQVGDRWKCSFTTRLLDPAAMNRNNGRSGFFNGYVDLLDRKTATVALRS
jgi:hypothetical protein